MRPRRWPHRWAANRPWALPQGQLRRRNLATRSARGPPSASGASGPAAEHRRLADHRWSADGAAAAAAIRPADCASRAFCSASPATSFRSASRPRPISPTTRPISTSCSSAASRVRRACAPAWRRRESIFSDDFVAVMLDTFDDHQRSYMFFSNPLGIQADGITTEGQDDDMSFDTVWQSRGRLTPIRLRRVLRDPVQEPALPAGRGPRLGHGADARDPGQQRERRSGRASPAAIGNFSSQFADAQRPRRACRRAATSS